MTIAPVTPDEDVEFRVDEGDHDRFAHVVYPKWKIVRALLTDTSVTALCGKVFKPTRDPKRFSLCPACKELAEQTPWGVPSE